MPQGSNRRAGRALRVPPTTRAARAAIPLLVGADAATYNTTGHELKLPMPLRTFLTVFGLFGGCLAIAIVAWATGSEFYLLMPPRGLGRAVSLPPHHPLVILFALAIPGLLYFLSPRHALIVFSLIPALLLLGSLVGYAVFAWTPTWAQWALSAATIVATSYYWNRRDGLFD